MTVDTREERIIKQSLETARATMRDGKELSLDECVELLVALELDQLPAEERNAALDAVDKVFKENRMLQKFRHSAESADISHYSALNRQSDRIIQEYRTSLLQPTIYAASIRALRNWDSIYPLLRNRISLADDEAQRAKQAAREKAKLLSVNERFRENVDHWRSEYRLVPKFPTGLDELRFLDPDDILRQWALDSSASEQDFRSAKLRVKRNLIDPFPFLDYLADYGLVVAALCFGLTPENILSDSQFDLIWTVARFQGYFGDAVVRVDDSEKFMGSILAIAYFAAVLIRAQRMAGDEHIKVAELANVPLSIRRWLAWALDKCDALGIDVAEPENIAEYIEKINGKPDDPPVHRAELYLYIRPDTNLKDLESVFPVIEYEQARLWGKKTTKRVWREYERDVELALIHAETGSYIETIRRYDQCHADIPIVTDGIYTKVADTHISIVKAAIKRFKVRARQ